MRNLTGRAGEGSHFTDREGRRDGVKRGLSVAAGAPRIQTDRDRRWAGCGGHRRHRTVHSGEPRWNRDRVRLGSSERLKGKLDWVKGKLTRGYPGFASGSWRTSTCCLVMLEKNPFHVVTVKTWWCILVAMVGNEGMLDADDMNDAVYMMGSNNFGRAWCINNGMHARYRVVVTDRES